MLMELLVNIKHRSENGWHGLVEGRMYELIKT